jgi:hypothetical protein
MPRFAILLPPINVSSPQIVSGALTLTTNPDRPPVVYQTPPTGFVHIPEFNVPDRTREITGLFSYVNADGLRGPSVSIGSDHKIPRPGAVYLVWLD